MEYLSVVVFHVSKKANARDDEKMLPRKMRMYICGNSCELLKQL